VAYVRAVGKGCEVRYATRGGGGWDSEVVEAFPDLAQNACIALDSAGLPRVAYSVWGAHLLRFARRTESGWTAETLDEAEGVGQRVSMALDSGDHAHVAYGRGSELVYATDASGTWVTTVVETGVPDGRPALAVTGSGTVGIAYLGTGGTYGFALRYATNESSEWRTEDVDPGFLGWWSAYVLPRPSVALDGMGKAHIGYPAVDRMGYAAGLVYATDANGTWVVSRVDGGGDASLAGFLSDVRDWQGIARYTVDESSAGVAVAVGNYGMAVGGHSALRLGADGLPRFAYADESMGDLKFARPDDGTAVPAFSAEYELTSGSALAGSDFPPVRGTLSWGAGDTGTKCFTVPVVDDAEAEGTETAFLSLVSSTPGVSFQPRSAMLVIRDDDGPNGTLDLTSVRIRGSGGRRRIEISGVLDTGPGFVDLNGECTLTMSSAANGMSAPGWMSGAKPEKALIGKLGNQVPTRLTREAGGSPRWRFRVRYPYASWIDPEAPLSVRFENLYIDASATVDLAKGRFGAGH
jgi:hypothetical protein